MLETLVNGRASKSGFEGVKLATKTKRANKMSVMGVSRCSGPLMASWSWVTM